MPSEIRGADNELLRLRSIVSLRQVLGFRDTEELKAFLESNRFKPYFDEYASVYILPQQERARAEGSSRPRGAGLEHVERRLISGERPGQDKFSCRRPDKTNWDPIDHCALMLYEIREANTKSVQGLFYRKDLSEHEMHIRIWALVKWAEFNTAPSRKKNSKNPSDKGKGKDQDEMELDTDDSVVQDPSDLVVGNPNDPNVFNPRTPRAETVRVGEHSVTFGPEHDTKRNLQLLNFLPVDDGSFIGDQALTNAQRMCQENNAEPYDIASRFWKAWTIDQVVGNQDDLDNLKHSHELAVNLDDLAIEEQSNFYKEITDDLEDDLIIIPEYTDPMRELHNQQQTWMDNILFQREDLQEACKFLSIPWDGENTVFRANRMSLSTKLEFWQPVAVKAIADFVEQEPALGGCLLADMMGIGKTWVVICFLIWHVDRIKRMPSTQTTPIKPTLILMPKKLIDQWITQVELVAPGFFTIYKYHGDAKRHEPVAGEKTIQGRLNRQHAIFDGTVGTANVIVITSYSTFTERHGPSVQKRWRVNKRHWTKTESDRKMDELDPKWPDRLDNMFGFVILDEAHVIKQINNKTSITIKWLHANFHILITATPIPNGIDDWKGYMPFIEHQDADQWWSDASLHEMDFEEDMNPYDLPNDHPATKLQLTVRGCREWIHPLRIDPTMKGLYLSKVWQRCMLRRTYSSQIPFKTGPTIGSKLPKVQAHLMVCAYKEDELVEYQMQADMLSGALLIPGSSDQRKVRWSLAVQRRLQMLTTSLSLPNIDAQIDLKAVNLKKVFEKSDFYLQWFDEEDIENPVAALWKLCDAAPKVRALLRNIRSQVIRDQEKVLVFCQLPAVATFLFAVFRILQLEVVIMHSYHSDQERQKIIDTFNQRKDRAQILILTFAVGGTGLNLQEMCWRVHIFESTTNLGIINQAVGRIRRLGSPSNTVYVYEYASQGTLDDVSLRRNLEKAIPEAAATLNRAIFSEGEGEDDEWDIGEWCLVDKTLMKCADVDMDALEGVKILTAHDLLRYILLCAKGQCIEV